ACRPLALIAAAAFASVAMQSCDSQEESRSFAAHGGADLSAIVPQHPHARVCAEAAPGFAACHARVRLDEATGRVKTFITPSGFGPADLASAYNLPATGGAGLTIAIVDAMDDPNAESDLATYRTQFGLPPCTTANGCFRKVNQNGATSPLPASD